LLADAIFSDQYLRDVTLPRIEDILTKDDFRYCWEENPCEAFADTRLVAGFQGEPWHLPREPRLAVMAGSVIVFRAKDKSKSIPFPAGNGEIRIGERIAEGFGRAVLWHPFHRDFKPPKEA
jgi:hypothetical protein